jgi:hypothetical protein
MSDACWGHSEPAFAVEEAKHEPKRRSQVGELRVASGFLLAGYATS